MSITPSFKVGDIVSNQQIVTEYKVGNMGGMRKNNKANVLVLVSDHTKGFYDDKWYDDILHYTGMGKTGDQELKSQNRTLAESVTNGVEIHLFEVLVEREYIYQGIVELYADPYIDVQTDISGKKRKVWVFPLKSTGEFAPVTSTALQSQEQTQSQKASKLSFDELEVLAPQRVAAMTSNRVVVSKTLIKDPIIEEYVKTKANGICQLCNQPAPFFDEKGKPYLETHYIEPLEKARPVTVENTVALCPNCHQKMRVLNLLEDRQHLLKH